MVTEVTKPVGGLVRALDGVKGVFFAVVSRRFVIEVRMKSSANNGPAAKRG